MKKISIGSWAYTIGPYRDNPVSWEEVVNRLSDLGFDGIELGGFPPHPNPDSMPEKDQREACRIQLAEKGLEWSGMAADLWGEQLINTRDPAPYLNTFRKNIQFCKDLGIPAIRVDTVQPPTIFEEIDHGIAHKRVVDTWKICAAEAADAGIRVTWEFEPGFAFNKPTDIFSILDGVNHENFGILFDACHAHMVAVEGARQPGSRETLPGGVMELAQKLRGRINHIHLIDSDGTLHDDETSTHAPFGEGMINFDELLPELSRNDTGHDWWTIDLCFWPDAWAATEKCKHAIDRLNEKYG